MEVVRYLDPHCVFDSPQEPHRCRNQNPLSEKSSAVSGPKESVGFASTNSSALIIFNK